MPQSQLSLFKVEPSSGQIRTSIIVTGFLVALFFAAVPFAHQPLPVVPAFIPMVDAILLTSDLISAVLLYAQASVYRSRALAALASGYIFTALILIPHALTFPGAFASTGLLGAGVSTTAWLYALWRLGFPAGVMSYALLRTREDQDERALSDREPITLGGGVIAAFLATVLSVFVTAGSSLLPPIMTNQLQFNVPVSVAVEGTLLGLVGGSIFLLLRSRKSVLDVWLLVASTACLTQLAILLITPARFTVGWYAGRTQGLLCHLIVMLVLVGESGRIYVRLAASMMSRDRERQARLLTMDAMTAAISHQVRQPLAAVITQASAGLRWLDRDPADTGEASSAFRAIAFDGRRIAEVIDSIRAMYLQQPSEKAALDINETIRAAVRVISAEAELEGVSLQMKLDGRGLLCMADGIHLQQVLLNLLANSIEASRDTKRQSRLISLSTEIDDEGDVIVTVSDFGSGIRTENLERIFQPFFTTKEHGTGIGLPLCRSIVDDHGGRVWCAETSSSGTTFKISLPRLAEFAP